MTQGLLFYDAAEREGEFYATRQGRISLSRLNTGWRQGWTHIVPGRFSANSTSSADGPPDLLFYDAAAGFGQFYATDGHGRISKLRDQPGWRNGWTHIVPGNFGGSGFTDLLFYDAAAGFGQFYATDGHGRISKLRDQPGWRNGWTHIVPGNFGGSGFTDLLFYDAAAGFGQFYATDGHGRISKLRDQPGWRNGWTHIVPGNFGGSGFTDLLFYDAAAGFGQFYATDGHGRISKLRDQPGWRNGWTHIVPGNFGGSGFTDLLFYDAAAGFGQFYATDGHGRISKLRDHPGWRNGWKIVVGVSRLDSTCVRVHVKSLVPIDANLMSFIDEQLRAMRRLYATRGINVVRLTTEDLSGVEDLQQLQVVNVGGCIRGQPTQDQRDLFENRNGVDEGEVVIYIVITLMGNNDTFLGCAVFPAGRPGAAVVVVGSDEQWLVAHEVGHVLTLRHVCQFPSMDNPNPAVPCMAGSSQSDNLMFPNVGWTDLPPDLSTAEETEMLDSNWTRPC